MPEPRQNAGSNDRAMKEKIGLIQTRGIGDIIIALPIADHYQELGFDVYWPIDHRFYEMFSRVRPLINFLPVPGRQEDGRDFFLMNPLRLLQEKGCGKTIILYSYISGLNICDTRLAHALKFDEYKYAIARVPFSKKWDLKLERDLGREEALFSRLGIERDFALIHETGSDIKIPLPIPPDVTRDFQLVYMDDLTDSPFDWLLAIERASRLIMLDSCFSNIVEQLNIDTKKRLVLRSDTHFTPVYRNGWEFGFIDPADVSSGLPPEAL